MSLPGTGVFFSRGSTLIGRILLNVGFNPDTRQPGRNKNLHLPENLQPSYKKQALLTRTAIPGLPPRGLKTIPGTVLAFLLRLGNPLHRPCFTRFHHLRALYKNTFRLLFFFIASYIFIKFTKFPA
jgi:hypothetical protein